jgi:hypothetical protein
MLNILLKEEFSFFLLEVFLLLLLPQVRERAFIDVSASRHQVNLYYI